MNTLWASEFKHQDLNQSLWIWASKQIFGDCRGFGPCATLGVFDACELCAVMVYHNFQKDAGVIEISGAAGTSRWLTRPVLKEMFSLPFDRMDCQTVVMRVSPDEKQRHIHRMLKAYGFQEYRLPRLRGRGEDELIFLLHDDVWQDNRFNRSTDISQKSGETLN